MAVTQAQIIEACFKEEMARDTYLADPSDENLAALLEARARVDTIIKGPIAG